MTDSAEMLPSYRLSIGTISYTICIDAHGIDYISPDGPFKTPDGVAVGCTLAQVTEIAKATPIKRLGWAYYVPLPSGWNAAFAASRDDPTTDPLPKDARVCFLFKSNWAKTSTAH